jgi:spermidine synthase
VFDVIGAHFDAGWLADRRVRLLREDGRNYVSHAAADYDVISLEVGQLFRPGIAAFYTAEFYRRARARLRPGGLVCQFVPLPFLTAEQFRGVVGTFLDVFPNAALWYNTAELLLIGTPDGALAIRAPRLGLLAADAGIHADLRFSHWGGPAEWLNQPRAFLAGFLCGPSTLRDLSADAPRYHDDRPVLEYQTAGATDEGLAELPIVEMLERRLDPIETLLDRPPPADSLAAIRALRDLNVADVTASALVRQASADAAAGRPPALDLTSRAVALNPRSAAAHRLHADLLLQSGRPAEARPHFEAALGIDPEHAAALRGLGVWLFTQARPDSARPVFEKLLAVRPRDAEAHNNLGAILANAGDLDGAIGHFRQALRSNPGLLDARRNLERLESARRTGSR